MALAGAHVSKARIAAQDTPTTQNLGPDGYSWSQAWPIQVDQFGNIFSLAQPNQGLPHRFVFSNDRGNVWQDSALEIPGFQRGTMAYDPKHNVVHILWVSQQPTEGVIYRRYMVERDGDDIIGFTADAAMNLQLDRQTDIDVGFGQPILIHLNDAEFGEYGALLALWAVTDLRAGHAAAEIRASMRILSNTAEDQVVSNWQVPIPIASATTLSLPAVPFTVLAASETGEEFGFAALRKSANRHKQDLYLFYADQRAWYFRRIIWNAEDMSWSGGFTAPVTLSLMARTGNDAGYNRKFELATKPVEDIVNDRVYFGFANWKSAGEGDTWSFVYVEANDQLSPIVDVYSAGGPHSFAPTGDITFDPVLSALIVSYIHSRAGAEYAYVKIYDGINQVQDETLLFDAAPVDIPLLWHGGRYATEDGDKLLILFRDATNSPNPPYQGYFGTMDLGITTP